MEHLGGVMWNLTSFHLKIVLVSGKIGALFAPNVPLAQKSFWTHPMVLLGDVGQLECCFGLLRASVGARLVHGWR